jgi:hypothetical protein
MPASMSLTAWYSLEFSSGINNIDTNEDNSFILPNFKTQRANKDGYGFE